MTVGLLHLRLRIPENHSLKGKRQVLLSLKDRIRQRFNVSVAETEDHEKWQAAALTVACVGVDQVVVDRTLNHVAEFAGRDREAQLPDVQMEFISRRASG